MQEDKKHEVYSLVKLQNLSICSPDVQKSVEMEPVKTPVKKIDKPLVKKSITKAVKPRKPLEKKIVKKEIVPIKKTASKEVVLARHESAVVEIEKKPLEKTAPEIQKESVQEEKVLVVKEEAVSQEKNAPSPVISQVKLSYEAQYLQDNIALINSLIKKNLFYPRLAKKRGLQGEAMVSFTLSLEGKILEIQALGKLSSILKKSAIKTIEKASYSFPHPQEVLALRIPIVYKLH